MGSEIRVMATTETTNDSHLSWYAAREPLVLVVLAAIAMIGFFAVGALSRVYRQKQEAQAAQWFEKGNGALSSGQAQEAVRDFRVALTYAPGDYPYQLRLAQSLLALNRTEEALQYLNNLWQREPENGTVNLELARIYAGKDDVTQALRYYHNAIYAIWNSDEDAHRRAVRLELTDFLLRRQSHGQAESELIALVGTLPQNPELIAHLADLFMQVPDYERALAEYRKSLALKRRNPAALAGAGRAAFELGRYREAEQYLRTATALNPSDHDSAQLLETAQLVREMNPYRPGVFGAKRKEIVLDAFNTAGARLNDCMAKPETRPGATDLQSLNTQWTQIKPELARRVIHADTLETAMNLVFAIEQQTNEICGAPQGKDLALLLVGKSREAE